MLIFEVCAVLLIILTCALSSRVRCGLKYIATFSPVLSENYPLLLAIAYISRITEIATVMDDKDFKDKIFTVSKETWKSAKISPLKNLGYTVAGHRK